MFSFCYLSVHLAGGGGNLSTLRGIGSTGGEQPLLSSKVPSRNEASDR